MAKEAGLEKALALPMAPPCLTAGVRPRRLAQKAPTPPMAPPYFAAGVGRGGWYCRLRRPALRRAGGQGAAGATTRGAGALLAQGAPQLPELPVAPPCPAAGDGQGAAGAAARGAGALLAQGAPQLPELPVAPPCLAAGGRPGGWWRGYTRRRSIPAMKAMGG